MEQPELWDQLCLMICLRMLHLTIFWQCFQGYLLRKKSKDCCRKLMLAWLLSQFPVRLPLSTITVLAPLDLTLHTFFVLPLGVAPDTCYYFSLLLWSHSIRVEPIQQCDVNRLTAVASLGYLEENQLCVSGQVNFDCRSIIPCQTRFSRYTSLSLWVIRRHMSTNIQFTHVHSVNILFRCSEFTIMICVIKQKGWGCPHWWKELTSLEGLDAHQVSLAPCWCPWNHRQKLAVKKKNS